MKNWLLVGLCLLMVCVALPALAAEDDGVMGVYEGDFTKDVAANYDIRAQVVGLNQVKFKAVFFLSENGGDELRVEAEGKRKKVGETKDKKPLFGPVNFKGELDVDGIMMPLNATIDDEVFSGTIDTDDGAFELKRVFKKPPTRGKKAPEGAIVLMDGNKETWLNQWETVDGPWCFQGDGSVEVCNKSNKTKLELGSGLYHIEFRTPYMPNDRYQARGNSGVYILGRYEVQVLDSFGTEPAWDLVGGIYKVSVPLADAALPPLQWQTYDITFQAPEFDASGKKTKNAVITVVHNGITVQDNLELPDCTPGGLSGEEATQGHLMLQHHSDPVRFRNIWFLPAE